MKKLIFVGWVNQGKAPAAIYDATGKKTSAIHRGVNIILYADGTRKKVIVK